MNIYLNGYYYQTAQLLDRQENIAQMPRECIPHACVVGDHIVVGVHGALGHASASARVGDDYHVLVAVHHHLLRKG
jgi:hypothetical protein